MFNLFSFLASRLKRIDDHCCYNNDHNCGEQIIVVIYITSFLLLYYYTEKKLFGDHLTNFLKLDMSDRFSSNCIRL